MAWLRWGRVVKFVLLDLGRGEGINKTHCNNSRRSQSGETGTARHIRSFQFLVSNHRNFPILIMGGPPPGSKIPVFGKKVNFSRKNVITAVLLVAAALPAVKPTPVYPSSKFFTRYFGTVSSFLS